MRKLLAVDPGGTTGWALANHDTGKAITTGEDRPYDFERLAESIAVQYQADLTIVCERFTIDARTLKLTRGGSYDALYQIGMLDYVSQRHCGRHVSLQGTDIKAIFTDAWLKRRGLYIKGGGGHANDALRHLSFRLAQDGVISVSGDGGTT